MAMDVKVPIWAGITEGILAFEEKIFLHKVRHLVMTRLVQLRVKPISKPRDCLKRIIKSLFAAN